MFLPAKKLFIIVAVLCLAISILAVVLILTRDQSPDQDSTIQQSDNITQTPFNEPDIAAEKPPEKQEVQIREFDTSFLENDTAPEPPSQEEQVQANLEMIVRNFVLEYGSYSSNSGYTHIEALYSQMISKMQDHVRNWIHQDPAALESSTFYSIETTISDLEIVNINNINATVEVSTQRQETDVPEYYNKRFNQKAKVELVKIGNDWKVAALYWE